MTPTLTEPRPQECEHYKNGKCMKPTRSADSFPHKCCMRVVKPMIECFYFTPKNNQNGK